MNNNLLIIFTRNPELGKVKTRLASKIGDSSALEIYKFLLQHTVAITKKIKVVKQVHYSVKVRDHDIWNSDCYDKKQQYGNDLGIRMEYAFQQGFKSGFENIIIIGSDIYDLSQQDIEKAFLALKKHNFVIGPAEDGGYYLIGMNKMNSKIFQNKKWGSDTVFNDTSNDLKNESIQILESRNDIDLFEDIENIEVFQQFIKQ